MRKAPDKKPVKSGKEKHRMTMWERLRTGDIERTLRTYEQQRDLSQGHPVSCQCVSCVAMRYYHAKHSKLTEIPATDPVEE